MDCSVKEKKIFAKILRLLNILSVFQKKFCAKKHFFLSYLFFLGNKVFKISEFHACKALFSL